MNTKRPADEQQFWDDIAKSIVIDCYRKNRFPEGCAHKARDVADAMLIERRSSASTNGKRGKQS